MRQDYDTAAYNAGKQTVIDPKMDFEAEAMRLARAYVLERSPNGTEEAMQVMWSFCRGIYAARNVEDKRASA